MYTTKGRLAKRRIRQEKTSGGKSRTVNSAGVKLPKSWGQLHDLDWVPSMEPNEFKNCATREKPLFTITIKLWHLALLLAIGIAVVTAYNGLSFSVQPQSRRYLICTNYKQDISNIKCYPIWWDLDNYIK